MEIMTRGKVARKAGVGFETIRFYERQGLIDPPSRKDSGYRLYPMEVVYRIRFIQKAKEVGFSLREIADLLKLRVDPKTTCKEVKKKADRKVQEIEEKIKALKKMKRALVTLSSSCKGNGPTSQCPLLDALGLNSGHVKGKIK